MVHWKTTPRKMVTPVLRPPPEYRLYRGYIHTQRQGLDHYVRDLAHMRDRVLRTGFRVLDYEASVHLLQTIFLGVRGLAPSIFYELLELDSFGRWKIDYIEFGCRLIRAYRHRIDAQLQIRGLVSEADRLQARVRVYFLRAAEHRERATQILEEVGIKDLEEDQMDWCDVTWSVESGPSRLPRVGGFPSSGGYNGDEESRGSTWSPTQLLCIYCIYRCIV